MPPLGGAVKYPGIQYPPSAQTAISILKTIESLPATVVSSVLAAHDLSGCDTVPQLFGIGKKKVMKLLKGHPRPG